MEIRDYRNLFSKKTWKQAVKYVEEEWVYSVDESSEFQEYSTQDQQENYSIYLYSDPQLPQGFRYDCSCSSTSPCKHLAAAILTGLEEKRLIEVETLGMTPAEYLNQFKEENSLIKLDEADSPVIENQTPQRVKKPTKKLVFIIKRREYSSYKEDCCFYLIPCSAHEKQDGSLSRPAQFISPESNLICSDEARELHWFINRLPSDHNRLLSLLPQLEPIDQLDLRIQGDDEIYPARIRPLESLQIEWIPETSGREMLYHPLFCINRNYTFPAEKLIWEHNYRFALFQVAKDQICHFKSRADDFRLLEELVNEKDCFSKSEIDILCKKAAGGFLGLTPPGGSLRTKKVLPRPRFMIREKKGLLEIDIFMIYGESSVPYHSAESMVPDFSTLGNERILYQRIPQAERALILYTLDLGEHITQLEDPFWMPITLEKFVRSRAERIAEYQGEIYFKEDKRPISTAPLQYRISSGLDWLDTRLSIKGSEISLPEILPKSGLIPYKGGYKLLTHREKEKLTALISLGSIRKGGLRHSAKDFYALSLMGRQIEPGKEAALPPSMEALQQYKKEFNGFSPEPPGKLRGSLRSYQQKSLPWLRFLYHYSLGGILADDMGLGKTIQAIALLLHITEQKENARFLICAPLSTLQNWEAELRKWAPELHPHVHQGPQRKAFSFEEKTVTPVLTSYQTLIRDEALFQETDWDTVILDESQSLKNPRSRSYQAVAQLKTRHFLALSGTPVENHIGELWALMNLLNPGLLGDLKGFIKRYQKPLQEGNRPRMEELKSRIQPFLLRRRKEEVARDLPLRQEILLTLPLSSKEQLFYDRQKKAYIAEIQKLKELKSKPFELSALVLQALNSLRQCAISPALRNGPDISTKLDLAMEKIEEACSENHKLLVFSQFTRVLDMMGQRLDQHARSYCRLDGSMNRESRDRAVEAFEKKDGPQVFLISIKAGGKGINLVEADYVLILDPWWNPAVENQAIDRSHRIGQTRPVTAYKWIAQNTVEEKVLALQQQKTGLVEDLLEGSSSPFQQMDTEEMINLF